jgi:hypothetical protein
LAGFVILLAVPPHSSRQLLCPSASFIQTLLIRSIAPCSLPHCLLQCLASCSNTHTKTGQDAQSLSQPGCHTELGAVHLAPFHCFLAISFQQASVHPLPIFNLLAGSPTWASFTLRLLLLIRPSFRKASLRFTCIVQPPSYPPAGGNILRWLPMVLPSPPANRGFTGSTFVGARRPPPLRRTSLFRRPSKTARNPYSADKCAAQLSFFFAAGAFTG